MREMKSMRSRLWMPAAMLAGIITLMFLVSLFQYSFCDDAFITFRYSRNLVLLKQFAYNPDEFVLGTTTPLYTLAGALVYCISGDLLPVYMAYISIALILVQAVFLFLIAGEFDQRWAGAASGIALLFSNSGSYRYLSMETNLLCVLEMAAVLFILKRRFGLSMVCAGLAALTRYDGIFLVLLFILIYWIKFRSIRIPSLINTALVVAPWCLFSIFYFGTLLPNTLYAKSGASGFFEYFISSGDYFFRQLAFCFTPWIKLVPKQFAVSMIILALYVLGTIVLVHRREEGLLFLIWPLMIRIGYSVIGSPVFHWWEIHKVVPISILPLWVGLFFIARVAEKNLFPVPEGRIRQAVKLSLILLLLVPKPVETIRAARPLSKAFHHGTVSIHYLKAARYIRRHTQPDASIMTPEIGVLGFYTERRIVDAAGLITPGIRFHQKTGERTGLDEIIHRYQPDYLFYPDLRSVCPSYEKIGTIGRKFKEQTLYKNVSLPRVENRSTALDYQIDDLLESIEDDSVFKPVQPASFGLALVIATVLIGFAWRINSGNPPAEPVSEPFVCNLKIVAAVLALVLLLIPALTLQDHSKIESRLMEHKPVAGNAVSR